MAINIQPGTGVVSDPNPGGPSALSNINNSLQKIIRLTFNNFAVTPVNTLVAVLPADATIIGITTWVRTALSGGTGATPTLAMGNVSGGQQFIAAGNTFPAGATGTYGVVTSISGILQNRNIPYSTDIPIWIQGTSVTGSYTAGEMYMIINYVR
jgi:hypothetical protein